MEVDERVATLEEEFKLIKGELKQTLSSVREYLMETGLPDSEYSTIMAAIAGGAERQQVEMKGDLSTPRQKEAPEMEEEEIVEEIPDDETSVDEPPADEAQEDGEVAESEAEAEQEGEEEIAEEVTGETEGELSQEEEMAEQLMEPQTAYARLGKGVIQSTPRVNLLANLIRWVANARKEIGSEQLSTFLEVYGICGHLTPELKEVILRLAEVAQPQLAEAGAADIWSGLLLELHGILTGGDAPAHPVKPFWSDSKVGVPLSEAAVKAEAAEPEPKEEPFKLKLVLTDSSGKDREFGLNLSPAAEGKSNKSGR